MRKRKMYLSVEDIAELFGLSVSFAYRVVERMNADLASKNYYVILGRVPTRYEGDEEEKNLNTLLDLLNESETREEDETYQNPVDMMFQELEERDPQHFAVRQYKKYKMAAGVVSLKRLLNQSNLKSWSSKMIKKSLEAYFFTLNNKIVFCKKQFQNMSVFCFVSTEIV